MHIFARNTARPVTPAVRPASTAPSAGKHLESAALEAISRGSHEAFAALFDRTAKDLAADLTARLPEPRQRIAILAATYVELWWLAGCRSDAESDTAQWINRIMDRRIADWRRDPAVPPHHESGLSRAEHELAELLGRPIEDLWPL
ncbi:hypothetical protein ACTOB_000832 [Actinoplanes oblitus]|uniref:RNA polymerase sigma-70 region 2 domain-containing protein n=1 Tax=Actinoplanes oblitus TaxID=3040509 RepID=A0ABY8WHH3_9ACTN|nr:hypothetical protein [Actinoplanes oblitus]WIM97324.1 hypothetical protein ACTOB_000832 [Actinoplanes oblitus]